MKMDFPNIKAFKDAEWRDPITQVVTYIAVDRGLDGNSEYHWIRNPAYSVKRELTAADEQRMVDVFLQAKEANSKIMLGSFDDMVNASDDVVVAIVDDPDLEINTQYGGVYYQSDGDMYKLVKLEGLIKILTGSDGSAVTNTTGGTTSPGKVDFGLYGVQVKGPTIILPNDGYYQIQTEVNKEFIEVWQGDGGVAAIVPYGTYKVINLSVVGLITTDVVVGSGIYSGAGTNAGTGTDVITNTGSTVETVGTEGVIIDGNSIIFPNLDYWQVQLVDPENTVFENNPIVVGQVLTVDLGVYNIINLTTNTRIDDIAIPLSGAVTGTDTTTTTDIGTSSGAVIVGDYGVQVDGLSIIVPDDGYYQIQTQTSRDVFEEVWQGNGGQTVTVDAGTYNVINLSIEGQRTNDVVVGA